MTLKTRLVNLENLRSINSPEMPEGLNPREQYLWMIRQPVPETLITNTYGLSPEEAYAWMVAA